MVKRRYALQRKYAAVLRGALTAQSGMTTPRFLLSMVGCLILIGLVAIWPWLNSLTRHTSVQTQSIVVAAHDIGLGASFDAASTQVTQWPVNSIPPGAISDQKMLSDRTARMRILRGEPVLEHQLGPASAKASLPATVKDGKRTISVKVDEVIGLSGFALAGNHVDVLVNFRNAKGNRASKMVVERVSVLAVVQMAGADDPKPASINAVTLEVSPEQAELLEIARKVGSLTLLVRSGAGKGSMRAADRTGKDAPQGAESLEGEIEKGPAPKRNEGSILSSAVKQSGQHDRVEVYRGVSKSILEF